MRGPRRLRSSGVTLAFAHPRCSAQIASTRRSVVMVRPGGTRAAAAGGPHAAFSPAGRAAADQVLVGARRERRPSASARVGDVEHGRPGLRCAGLPPCSSAVRSPRRSARRSFRRISHSAAREHASPMSKRMVRRGGVGLHQRRREEGARRRGGASSKLRLPEHRGRARAGRRTISCWIANEAPDARCRIGRSHAGA